MQNQPAAHTRPPVSDFPEEKGVRDKIVIEIDFIRVRPVEVCHEGLAQLAADTRIADSGVQILPAVGKDLPGTASGRIQRNSLERRGAVWLAAIPKKCLELGPAQGDGLLRTLHAVIVMSGQPGEVKLDPVALFVKP